MRQIHLTYHGVIYSKKNSKQIIWNKRTCRPQIISNANAKEMEEEMIDSFFIQSASQGWRARERGIYDIEMTIFTKDRRRRDLDNMATAILDALVLSGTINDDSIPQVSSIRVEYGGVDKTNPRAEITIKERS